jgi:hypothetical protein
LELASSFIEESDMDLRPVDRLGILIVIAGGLAGVPAAMPALQAQTPSARQTAPVTNRNQDNITVTGCLLLGPYGDYTLSKTIVAPGEPLNAVAWKLEGNNALLGHILEQIEVTGTMQAVLSDAGVPVAASTRPRDRAASYRLRVKTIRKLASGCS